MILKKTFENFSAASDMFINKLISTGKNIMEDEILGYLSTCPSNLGTGFKVTMRMKIPNLIKNRTKLNEICKNHSLEIKNLSKQIHTNSGTNLDISNKKNIGVTNIELLQSFINGVTSIIQTEEKM